MWLKLLPLLGLSAFALARQGSTTKEKHCPRKKSATERYGAGYSLFKEIKCNADGTYEPVQKYADDVRDEGAPDEYVCVAPHSGMVRFELGTNETSRDCSHEDFKEEILFPTQASKDERPCDYARYRVIVRYEEAEKAGRMISDLSASQCLDNGLYRPLQYDHMGASCVASENGAYLGAPSKDENGEDYCPGGESKDEYDEKDDHDEGDGKDNDGEGDEKDYFDEGNEKDEYNGAGENDDYDEEGLDYEDDDQNDALSEKDSNHEPETNQDQENNESESNQKQVNVEPETNQEQDYNESENIQEQENNESESNQEQENNENDKIFEEQTNDEVDKTYEEPDYNEDIQSCNNLIEQNSNRLDNQKKIMSCQENMLSHQGKMLNKLEKIVSDQSQLIQKMGKEINNLQKHLKIFRVEKMVEKVSTTKSYGLTIVPNFQSIMVKQSRNRIMGHVPIIFGGVDKIDSFSVRPLASSNYFSIGWSCVDEVKSSFTYFGRNGWISAGIWGSGRVSYYQNFSIGEKETGLSSNMSQRYGATTEVDRINKTVTFSFGYTSYRRSFAELNLTTCKNFYPAVIINRGVELVIEKIMYTA